MGTTGSVDGAGRLVIKGRFQQKQVENVLRRYIGTIGVCLTGMYSLTCQKSGICYVQDMQITGYAAYEGESYLLHVLRILRQ